LFDIGVLGGFGSIAGPAMATLYYFAGLNIPYVATIGAGAGVISFLMLLPGGLSQLLHLARDAVLRQIALRHRIVVPSLLADYRREAHGTDVATLGPQRRGSYVVQRYRLANQWKIDEAEAGNG